MTDAEQIKDKIDIVEFISEYVDLKKSGRNFKGLCPFHSEKSPSFHVSADRQIWHCFGACDEGGDVISFYMKAENTTFPEALKELAKRVGVTLNSNFEHDKSWQEKNRLYEINHLASEYYHYILTKHAIGKEARVYVTGRNISDKIIKTFMLGYAPDGWRNLLPFLKKKGYEEEEIEKAGLAIRGSNGYYDRFRGRIIFTLKDHRGNIVGLSGRVLEKNAKQAKYINSPETLIYHKSKVLYGLDVTQQAIQKHDAAIICEGEFDVLSSFQQGIANIVAIKGTALTKEQLSILKRYTGNIILALDMDVAGDQAARRSIESAEALDFNIKVVQLTNGKDLDEALSNSVTKTKKAIEEAPSVYDFILSSAIERHGLSDAVSKKNVAADVTPLYAKIQNAIVRDFFIKKLADALETSTEAILEQMREEERKKRLVATPATRREDQHAKRPLAERREEHLLSLLVQSPQSDRYLQKLDKTITIEELETPAIRRIIVLLHQKKDIPAELADTYNKAYLQDIQSIVSEQDRFDREFDETVTNIKRTILKSALKRIATQMKNAEDDTTLNDEFIRISRELKEL